MSFHVYNFVWHGHLLTALIMARPLPPPGTKACRGKGPGQWDISGKTDNNDLHFFWPGVAFIKRGRNMYDRLNNRSKGIFGSAFTRARQLVPCSLLSVPAPA